MSEIAVGALGAIAVAVASIATATWLMWRWEERQINRAVCELTRLS